MFEIIIFYFFIYCVISVVLGAIVIIMNLTEMEHSTITQTSIKLILASFSWPFWVLLLLCHRLGLLFMSA